MPSWINLVPRAHVPFDQHQDTENLRHNSEHVDLWSAAAWVDRVLSKSKFFFA